MSADRLEAFRAEHAGWTVRRDVGSDYLVYSAQRVQVVVAGSLDELGDLLGRIGAPGDDPRVARARQLASEHHPELLTLSPGEVRQLADRWRRAVTDLLAAIDQASGGPAAG